MRKTYAVELDGTVREFKTAVEAARHYNVLHSSVVRSATRQNKMYPTKRSRTKFFYSRTFAYEYAAIRKRENNA